MTAVFRKLQVAALLALAGLFLPAAAVTAQDRATAAAEEGMRALQAADLKVATIVFRLATANRDLCHTNTPLTGLVLSNLDQYGAESRPVARRLFNIGDAPTVEAIVPGSPAEQAGLKVGDWLLAVNAVPLWSKEDGAKPRKSARADYGLLGEAVAKLDAALVAGTVTLSVERDGVTREISLAPISGCPSAIQLLPSGKRDAGADGKMISLTTGMYDFARNDDELATVISHELAHNGLQHRVALDAKDVRRGVLGQFGKNATRIRQTECEADHVGIYYMARAGFDIAVVPEFYRRLGGTYDLGPLSDRTHPSGKKREEAARDTLAEIAAKQAGGLPLLPDPRCGDHLG